MTDVVVVGAGMAGASAAWALARRGRSVLLVDRFARGHDRGSSHGAERIFRFGYTEQAYVQLAQESLAGWHELPAAAGAPLLHLTGVVDHGDEGELAEMTAACESVGMRVETMTAAEARPAGRDCASTATSSTNPTPAGWTPTARSSPAGTKPSPPAPTCASTPR